MWRGAIRRRMGIRLSDRREFEAAVELFSQVLALDPKSETAYLQRGVLYWRELNLASLAVSDLTNALRLRPGWPVALFNRALAWTTLGRYAAAIDDLRAYLATGDSDWQEEALRQLALLEESGV